MILVKDMLQATTRESVHRHGKLRKRNASQSESSRPCLVWAEQRRTTDGLLGEGLVRPSVDATRGAHGQTGVWSGRVGDRRKLALIVEAAVNGWWAWRETHVRQTGVRSLGSDKLSRAGMPPRPYDSRWTGHDAWISGYGGHGIFYHRLIRSSRHDTADD